MNWIALTSDQAIEEIKKVSEEQPVLIFKHSTRCAISSTSLNRLERNWNAEDMQRVKPYFLDLIAYRTISNQVAQEFDVAHQSPQLLLIKNGQCVYHSSHMAINYNNLKKVAI